MTVQSRIQTKPIKCSADCHMSADTSNLPSVRRKRSLHPSTIHGDWAKIGFVCTACNVHCTVLQHSKHIKHQVSTTKNDPITLNFLSMIWIRTNMMQTREPKFTYIRKPTKYIYLWFLPVFPGISCRHPGDHPPHRRLQTAESILKVGWKN